MRQAVSHKLPIREGMDTMEMPSFYKDGKPSKVVYSNEGQTRVTLTGKWFFMTPEENEDDFQSRLSDGDPLCVNINNALCSVYESNR